MSSQTYESKTYLDEYLGFHYGEAGDFCPWQEVPLGWMHFPQRCADALSLRVDADKKTRALDIGCAVGGASFELAKSFGDVLGVDNSHSFIDACNRLKDSGEHLYERKEEGDIYSSCTAKVGGEIDRSKVHFCQGDACEPHENWGDFDAVLAANLIDRLPDPSAFLSAIPPHVRPGGYLMITSPYTWLEIYTAKEKWLCGGSPAEGGDPTRGLDGLKKWLQPQFTLKEAWDMPFLIREHSRKYQWSVAQASLWIRC